MKLFGDMKYRKAEDKQSLVELALHTFRNRLHSDN